MRGRLFEFLERLVKLRQIDRPRQTGDRGRKGLRKTPEKIRTTRLTGFSFSA